MEIVQILSVVLYTPITCTVWLIFVTAKHVQNKTNSFTVANENIIFQQYTCAKDAAKLKIVA